jgi:hypothetical protein
MLSFESRVWMDKTTRKSTTPVAEKTSEGKKPTKREH